MTGHDCATPAFFRMLGEQWTCPRCSARWELRTEYDYGFGYLETWTRLTAGQEPATGRRVPWAVLLFAAAVVLVLVKVAWRPVVFDGLSVAIVVTVIGSAVAWLVAEAER